MALFRMAFFRLFALVFRYFALRISLFRLFAWRYFVFSLFRLAFFFVISSFRVALFRFTATSSQGCLSRKNALVDPSIYSIRMTSCSLSRSEGIFVCIEAWFNYLNCVKTTENNELWL